MSKQTSKEVVGPGNWTSGFLASSSGSERDNDAEGWTLAGDCAIVGETWRHGVLGFLHRNEININQL